MNSDKNKKTTEEASMKKPMMPEGSAGVGNVSKEDGARAMPQRLKEERGGVAETSGTISKGSGFKNVSVAGVRSSLFNTSIESFWIGIVIFGALLTAVFFAYAGYFFWNVTNFESAVTAEESNDQNRSNTIQEEQVRDVRTFYEEQEEEFERLQSEQIEVPEVW